MKAFFFSSYFVLILFSSFLFLNSSLYIGSNDMACTTDLQPSLKNQTDSELIVQEVDYGDESEYDEDEALEEINRELS